MAESTNKITVGVASASKRRSYLGDLFYRLLKEKPLGTFGAAIVLILLLAGLFAPLLAPYAYDQTYVAERLSPPSGTTILGTDQLGRDVLSRIIYGARISMIVSLSVSTLSVVISTAIGLISGFMGHTVDLVIQRFVDAWMCFPGIFLILTIMAILGPGLWQVIIVLGFLGGITGSRVIRSTVLNIKENVYVDAAKAIGCPTSRILMRHILPNITAPIIIMFTTGMGAAIIAEASISFLGWGIPPPVPSWGGMLSTSGRTYMMTAPWLAVWPGLALTFVVYGINMFGDALRDLLDPRLRGGLGRYSGTKKKMPKQSAPRK
ncbi:MAG TPA: ABC transporter permease [Dehalococcoidales bacterium]